MLNRGNRRTSQIIRKELRVKRIWEKEYGEKKKMNAASIKKMMEKEIIKEQERINKRNQEMSKRYPTHQKIQNEPGSYLRRKSMTESGRIGFHIERGTTRDSYKSNYARKGKIKKEFYSKEGVFM